MKQNKTVIDLYPKHFSRYGEFLVSFELSKRGWNVYSPVYDEYIDFLIHKHVYPSYAGLQPEGLSKQLRGSYTRANSFASGICIDCGKWKKFISSFDKLE